MITVKAKEALVPMERSRKKIGASPVRVKPSPYYRRLIREGYLIVMGEAQAPSKKATPKKEGSR